MNVKEAYKIVKKKNPNMPALYCTETENWFKFVLGNQNGELIGNSSVYAVNKETGDSGWINYFLSTKEFRDDRIINTYSREDILI